MSFWNILGIEPTSDKEKITKAYYSELNLHHPEEDPEGFQKLREAYEKALENHHGEILQDYKLNEFIPKVQELYENFYQRINEKNWEELLKDPICIKVDTFKETEKFLLEFFMEHYYMPHKVWKTLNEFFLWSERQEELYREFPKDFIDFIIDYSKRERGLRYNLFPLNLDIDFDKFILFYNEALAEMNRGDMYKTHSALKNARKIYDEHLDLKVLLIRYEVMNNRIDRVIELCNDLLKNNEEEKNLYILKGEALLRKGNIEAAYDNFKIYYDIEPVTWTDLYNISRITVLLGKFDEASEILYKLKENWNYSKDAYYLLEDINEKKASDELENLLSQLSKKPRDIELLKNVAKCYYDLGEYNKSIETLKTLGLKIKANEDAKLLMGNCYLGLNNKKKAYLNLMNNTTPEGNRWAAMGYEEARAYYSAIDHYDKAIGMAEDSSIYKSSKARVLCIIEEYQQALELCNNLLEENPMLPQGYNNRATALYNLGRYEEALADCETAISILPSFFDAYINKSKVFNAMGRYYEAIDVCEEGFEIDINNKFLYYEKAYAMYQLNRLSAALSLCKIAMENNDDSHWHELYYLMGEIYYLKGDFNEAFNYYDQAIMYKKNSAIYYTSLGDAKRQLGDISKAISLYGKALEIKENYNYPRIERAKLYKNKMEYEKAIADLNYILENKKGNEDCYILLGDIYKEISSKEEEFDKAISFYTEALKINDENGYTFVNRGICYWSVKKYDEGLKDFNKAIELDDKYIYAYYYKAICYQSIENYEEAFKIYENITKIDDSFYDVYYNLGICNMELNREQEALLNFTKTVELNKGYGDGWFNRGACLYNSGRYDEALRDFQNSIDNRNDESKYTLEEAYECLSSTFIKLNREEEAIKFRKKALNMRESKEGRENFISKYIIKGIFKIIKTIFRYI